MKIIGLDIETMNLDMVQDNLDFDNPEGWQVSCVCIHDHHRDLTYQYMVDPSLIEDIQETDLIYDWSFLGWDLEEWFYQGYTLVTKNGASFDLPIINKSIEDGGCGVKNQIENFLKAPKTKETKYGERELPPKHIDICKYLRDVSDGYRFSLENLIKGCLGESEGKLMPAAEAPKAWAIGDYRRVLAYCCGDAKHTTEIFYFGRREGRILAVGKKEDEEKDMKVKVMW
jgi:DNA polymerase elongation subunit (family B)